MIPTPINISLEPNKGNKKNPNTKVPTTLPKVLTAYNVPALEATPSKREVPNLIAKGPTMPKKVKLGKNKIKALTKAPARKPNGSVANSTGRAIHGIIRVKNAANAIIKDKPVRCAQSAHLPPTK